MHEFMEYVFQPAYLRLKQAMATAPADNKGWKALKSDSLILAESCNLLFDRAPDEKAADWKAHAKAAREKGGQLYSAAKAKSFAFAAASCIPQRRQRTLLLRGLHGRPCWKAATRAIGSLKTASTFCSHNHGPQDS